MDEKELKDWIVEELAKGRPEQDLVLRLTQKNGMYWPDAEALVRQVAEEQSEKIERKQAPILAILAMLLFAGGTAVILLGLSPFYMAFMGERAMPLNAATLAMILFQWGSESFWLLVTGAAMVMGSLIGMRRVWSNFLNDL